MIHTCFQLLLSKFYSGSLQVVSDVIFTNMMYLNEWLEKGEDSWDQTAPLLHII